MPTESQPALPVLVLICNYNIIMCSSPTIPFAATIVLRYRPYLVFLVSYRSCTIKQAATASQSGSSTALVASYGDDSDADDDEVLDESRLIDYSKLTCLLCKRQFGSKDILQKHQQMSDLHKVCGMLSLPC